MQAESYEQILARTPFELQQWLVRNFTNAVILPEVIDTIEDMNNAAGILLRLTGYYSYLVNLLGYAKLRVRQTKRQGKEEKAAYEDMVDKRDLIDLAAASIKMQYQAVSRAVTIHQENCMELRMNGNGYIAS